MRPDDTGHSDCVWDLGVLEFCKSVEPHSASSSILKACRRPEETWGRWNRTALLGLEHDSSSVNGDGSPDVSEKTERVSTSTRGRRSFDDGMSTGALGLGNSKRSEHAQDIKGNFFPETPHVVARHPTVGGSTREFATACVKGCEDVGDKETPPRRARDPKVLEPGRDESDLFIELAFEPVEN